MSTQVFANIMTRAVYYARKTTFLWINWFVVAWIVNVLRSGGGVGLVWLKPSPWRPCCWASPHKIYRIHHTLVGYKEYTAQTRNSFEFLNLWHEGRVAKRHEQGSWAGGRWSVRLWHLFGRGLICCTKLRGIAQESNQLSGNARSMMTVMSILCF